jgi:hypothetical protein
MLLRFRVANYASLRDGQELSLIAVDDHPDLATRPVPRETLQTLPAVGIFGQNASGKSNVLKALGFAARAVRDSHQRWLPEEGIPRWPFQLDAHGPALPSQFVFELVLDGVRYEYGFAVDDDAVRREWLYAYPVGKRRTWFERDDHSMHFGSSLTGPRELIAEVVRPDSLFLSAAAANNHRQLSPVYQWFTRHRQVSARYIHRLPPPRIPPSDRMLRLLRYADLGIVGAELVVPDARDERQSSARSAERSRARPVADRLRDPTCEGIAPVQPEPFGGPVAPGQPTRVELAHLTGTGTATLPWGWESTGTHAWWALLGPALLSIDQGTLLTIDDLGSGLHPLLTAQLIRLFEDPVTNANGAQLIFNTHDTGLLGRHHGVRLVRDQVWLTEKDRDGATRLFPLTEFRVRDGLDDVEGRYLKGRYGAVPFFDEDLLSSLADSGEPAR